MWARLVQTGLRVAAVLALSVQFAAARTSGKPLSPEVLQTLSKEASSAKEHGTVARHYHARAEALEQKARRHEETARRLMRGEGLPMASKWPAMMQNTIQLELDRARQARESAQESFTIAARHAALSTDGQFSAE